jgi:hypothetical protein
LNCGPTIRESRAPNSITSTALIEWSRIGRHRQLSASHALGPTPDIAQNEAVTLALARASQRLSLSNETEASVSDDWVKLPGLFRRSELCDVIEPARPGKRSDDFLCEAAQRDDRDEQLYAIYHRHQITVAGRGESIEPRNAAMLGERLKSFPPIIDLEENFLRLPRLFRRWELKDIVEAGPDFHFEEAGTTEDGTALFAVYRPERSDGSNLAKEMER